MTYQLLNLPVEQLRLDPRNPRLWGHEPTDDQDKIARPCRTRATWTT